MGSRLHIKILREREREYVKYLSKKKKRVPKEVDKGEGRGDREIGLVKAKGRDLSSLLGENMRAVLDCGMIAVQNWSYRICKVGWIGFKCILYSNIP